MALDLTEFREVFFDEVAEYLVIIERCMREISLGNGGSGAVAEAYRCAHSIKGASATFGFDEMRDRAGSLAGMLDLARQGQLVLDAAALESCRDEQAVLAAQLAARRCGTKATAATSILAGATDGVCPDPASGEDDAGGESAERIEAAVASLRQTAADMQDMMATMERLSREHAELADRAALTALEFERQMRALLADPALAERSMLPLAGESSSGRVRRGEGAPLPKVKAAGVKRRSLEQEWEEI